MGRKIRVDKLLVEKNYFPSRERSRQAIESNLVYADGVLLQKTGTLVDENSDIHIKEHKEYVSRGAIKLNKALDDFGMDIKDKVVIDVGASTGGFTQCLLERGAVKVAALDVGYGQLDWKIRTNPRVDVFERQNIRYFAQKELGYFVDLAVIDVSFISISKVIKPVHSLFGEKPVEIIVLVKPQFEAPKGSVGKGGVVKDEIIHRQVLVKLASFLPDEELFVKDTTFSPLKGAKGNIEFFVHITSIDTGKFENIESFIEKTVKKAHDFFKE